MRTIWYMGVKTRLTADIQAAVREVAEPGTSVLDLMSGSGTVSRILAPEHRVIANDVQAYAAAIAEAYLCHDPATQAEFAASLDPERDLGPAFRRNQQALLAQLAPAVAVEDAFLRAAGLEPATPDADGASRLAAGAQVPASSRRIPRDAAKRAQAYRAFALEGTPTFLEEREASVRGPFRAARSVFARETIAARRAAPETFPYLLASSYYPNVYLGLRQAIATDSLRYAIDQLAGPGAALLRAHYLAALLYAVSVSTSATSHFAQPRGLTRDAEVQRVLLRRALSVPSKLVAGSRAIAEALRATPLRAGNQVRQSEWRALYADWEALEPDVVYADPPYTADNYSRFYHVLEVLTRYDYPELALHAGRTTKGRYPTLPHRHRSAFCVKQKVEDELRDLFRETARRGAALVFSYAEENGLLLRRYRDEGLTATQALERLQDLARESYRSVRLHRKALMHSGQGDSNPTVTELLLVAHKPRRRPRAAHR